jgi:hypothetical protein
MGRAAMKSGRSADYQPNDGSIGADVNPAD